MPWGDSARQHLLASALVPGISAERAVAARLTQLRTDPGCPPDWPPPALDRGARSRWRAAAHDPRFAARVAAERAALDRLGAWYLTPLDRRWGAQWPAGILRGRGTLIDEGVAIVGARGADRYGRDVARRVAEAAVARGRAVISGGAFGIDHAAHSAALEAGGRTVVVLGSGLDRASPAAHRGLFDAAMRRGAVVSPFPCAQTAARWTFPRRNPWIAALSAAVIVVQAGRQSGALHTARAALERGIPVYVVPGPMDAPLHAGCHALVDEGARLLTTVDAWADDALPPPEPDPQRADGMAPDHRALWLVCSVEARPIAELAADAGLSIDVALQAATVLELDGMLRAVPGGRYARA